MPRLTSEQIAATRQALAQANGNRAAAARTLGMSYLGLLQRLKRIDVSDLPGPRRGRTASGTWKPAAPDELVQSHLYVVDRLANNYKARLPANVSIDDLVQAGRIGLMQAAASFDPQRGIKFATYCTARVQGAMADELRKMDPVPRLTRRREKLRRECEEELRLEEIEPTPNAVCKRLGWSAAEYRDSFPRTDESLDHTVFYNDAGAAISNGDLLMRTPAPQQVDVDEAARELMRGLSLEQMCVLYLYHWRGATMKAIGQAMNLSESRISQLHSDILERLRSLGREAILDRVA